MAARAGRTVAVQSVCEGGRDPRRGRGQRRGVEAAARGVCGMLSPGSSAHGDAAARWQQWQEGRRQEREMGRWRRVVL